MSKSLKEAQLGFFYKTPFAYMDDLPDGLYRLHEKICDMFQKNAKKLSIWTQDVKDCGESYTLNPFEFCEPGFEIEEVDGKAALSVWIFMDAWKISDDDRSTFVETFKQTLKEFNNEADQNFEFIGYKTYNVYTVSETSDLMPE